ncbi:TRAF-type zinc finger domain-containing protein 1 isoform X2 [Hyla sarda]|nr:TRAF-type zinc finger domain-containing protein 1 isoform X2 [Hyla sarda]
MASSAEQETLLCGNCKRDIPVDNFTIHEIHCKRNISMCKLCKEPIPKSDMEDHYASEHVPVTCKCNMTMEKCAQEEHEISSCPLRMAKCQFCDLEVTFNKLGNHEDYCGARTEPCEKCGSSVMIKDLNGHPTVCGKVKQQKKQTSVHSWADNRNYEVPSLSSLNSRSTIADNFYSRRSVPERFYGKSILNQSSKKFDDLNQNTRREQNGGRGQPNVDLNIDSPLDLLHQFLEETPKAFSDFRSQNRQNTQSGPEPADPFTENNQDFWHDLYYKDNKMKANAQGRRNLDYLPNDDSMHLNSPSTPTDDAIQLPCEFCEKLFPEEDLILHQSGCRPSVSSSDRRCSPSPPLDFDEILRSSSPPSHNPQSVLIPCEFCGVLMEGDILFHHQDQCDMGPNSEKTSQFSTPTFADDVSPAEEDHRSNTGPTASQLHGPRTALGGHTAVFSRNQTRAIAENTRRDHNRIDNLYRSTNTHRSNLEEMRKRNIEENASMVRHQYQDVFGPTGGASNRTTGTRNK